jgi:hypothetical protein
MGSGVCPVPGNMPYTFELAVEAPQMSQIVSGNYHEPYETMSAEKQSKNRLCADTIHRDMEFSQ